MAMTGVPKEQMSAYQRWELASFDEETPTEIELREKQQAAENARTVQLMLKQVRQEAYEAGFKTGYVDGMAHAETVLAQERTQLSTLAESFSQALSMHDQKVAESILTLSLEMAKAMLKTELQVNVKAVIPVVLDAMHYLPQVKQPARLILHHDDANVVRAHLGEELFQQGWQVLEDASIERGGCVVETAENQIDATNEMRWKRMTQALSRHDEWHSPVLTADPNEKQARDVV